MTMHDDARRDLLLHLSTAAALQRTGRPLLVRVGKSGYSVALAPAQGGAQQAADVRDGWQDIPHFARLEEALDAFLSGVTPRYLAPEPPAERIFDPEAGGTAGLWPVEGN